PLTPILESELSTFTAKITAAGNETFQADWRTKAHDDIVLATAIAAWVGENCCVGPFQVNTDRDNRTIMSDVPEGVFHDNSDRITWPWER
ncbi:MAG TPA: hypothetical protein VMG10_31020, partial [Gemmataceae bacterium]|nr:hypothetical protein [Gemmataceae bacterium]